MSMVHASRGFLKPPSDEVRSEPWIIAQMARATLGAQSPVDWEGLVGNYDLIRDKIEIVFPDFEGYNARVRQPGGFVLPNSAAMRIWNTPSGKANFLIFNHLEEDLDTDQPDVLRLASMRSHDQYNTTIYGLDDRYRGVFGRRDVLFLNEAEMTKRGLSEGDLVNVETALQFAHPDRIIRALTVVRYDLPDGCCGAYYPETQPLIALEHIDPQCLTPSYKSIPVRLTRATVADEASTTVTREGLVGRASEGIVQSETVAARGAPT